MYCDDAAFAIAKNDKWRQRLCGRKPTKEAYIKAHGTALPLDAFDVSISRSAHNALLDP
jgi:hypothetical protein